MFTLTVQDQHQTSESDAYRRHILTSKAYPRAVRVRGLGMHTSKT